MIDELSLAQALGVETVIVSLKKEEINNILIRNNAYIEPYPIGVKELYEIIDRLLLKNNRALEMLNYDILSIIYKMIVVGSSKYNWLQALVAISDNSEIQKRWELIIQQIINKHPKCIEVEELRSSYGREITTYTSLKEDKVSGHSAIRSTLCLCFINYLMRNYDYVIYNEVDSTNYWRQDVINFKHNLVVINRTFIIFHEVNTVITLSNKGNDNESNGALDIYISSNILDELIKKEGVCVNLTSLSSINTIPEYKKKVFPLSSFTYEGPKHIDININKDRLGLLLYGSPGTGKTSWAFSFYEEVLRPNGYVLIIVSYQEYINLYIDLDINICVLVNDADYIETEETRATVLSKLESNLGSKRIVTIFTVNSRDNFDEALMRNGRFDYTFIFNQRMI